MPWIVLDPKRDALLGALKKDKILEEIRIDQKPPSKPGLYIAHYYPETIDDGFLDGMLALILRGSNTGIYVDEGFTVPNRPYKWTAYSRIQNQGRAKHIPTITLSQRPMGMSRFIWSEASYFQYFGLTDADDRATVRRFALVPTEDKPKRFHSWWWDVANQEATRLRPVPKADIIQQIFRDRVGKRFSRFL